MFHPEHKLFSYPPTQKTSVIIVHSCRFNISILCLYLECGLKGVGVLVHRWQCSSHYSYDLGPEMCPNPAISFEGKSPSDCKQITIACQVQCWLLSARLQQWESWCTDVCAPHTTTKICLQLCVQVLPEGSSEVNIWMQSIFIACIQKVECWPLSLRLQQWAYWYTDDSALHTITQILCPAMCHIQNWQ